MSLTLYSRMELYVPVALTISNSAFCIYGFSVILSVNTNYFLEERQKLTFIMVTGRILI